MVYMTYVFWNPLDDVDNKFGDISTMYSKLICAQPDAENEGKSALTFISKNGMMEGILLLLGKSVKQVASLSGLVYQ